MPPSNRNNACTSDDARSRVVPAGTPDWITVELIERTIRVWQPFYPAILTPEEAVTMLLNVGRLFDVLSSRSSP